jgi:hypothetical protein
MRLTLRTLLAYLDDILDPADAEALRQKIEQSEFATGLVHRVRSATHRLRLGVPTLHGKGMGLDPNTVAEYLDNELVTDRVPEFEKVCLESDIHLAEVAACHQILTLVLGQAVDIAPELRQRMLLIGAEESAPEGRLAASAEVPAKSEPAVVAEPTAPPPVDTSAEPAVRVRTQPEVPEYLRAGRRSKLGPLAITLILAFLVCGLLLRAAGPFNREHPLARLFGRSPSSTVAKQDGREGQPEGATAHKPPTSGGEAKPPGDASPNQQPKPVGPAAKVAVGKPAPPGNEKATGPAPKVEPLMPEKPESDTKPDGLPDIKLKPDPLPAGDPASPVKPTEEPLVEKPKTGVTPAEEPQVPAGKGKPPGPGTIPAKPGEVVEPAAEAVVVGQLKPTNPTAPAQVLLGLNPKSGEWTRLLPPAKLVSGEQLLVLPAFSPEIVLSRGVQVAFAGPSHVRPLAGPNAEEPALAVAYGRAFMYTAGVAGARVHLDLAGHKGAVTFTDPTSEVAVEVKRYLPPGSNPEQEPGLIVIQIFTTVGRVQWEDQVVGVSPIDAGQVQIMIADRLQTVAAGELPSWVRRDGLSNVDRLAASALEAAITSDRAVSLSLKEQSKNRKSEVRGLAARALAYLDSFDALVSELSDEQQRPYWPQEFEALRDSLSRKPTVAAQVRETLERLCGEDAPKLYRLLWGYSPQQLQGRDAEQLVAFLDHDSLPLRVLAFENLRRITKKTLLYRPEVSKTRRKSSVRSWQDQLKDGVAYATLPSPTASGE